MSVFASCDGWKPPVERPGAVPEAAQAASITAHASSARHFIMRNDSAVAPLPGVLRPVSSSTGAGTGVGTVSTPPPREVFVEHLVSQNRNSTNAISGSGGCPNAPSNYTGCDPVPTRWIVGQTYTLSGTQLNGIVQGDIVQLLQNTVKKLDDPKDTCELTLLNGADSASTRA